MSGEKEAILNEGFQVIPAEVPLTGKAKNEGNSKKFETFVVDPIDEQKGDTKAAILDDLRPNSRELLYHEGNKQLIYDLEFFASIEMGEAFIKIWDIIVKNDNDIDKKNAIGFLRKFFSATSQIALKMEMERQDGHTSISFDNWFVQSRQEDFLVKFMKKTKELNIKKQYNSLCKDFEPFYACTENIIYHSLKQLEDINFGSIGLSLGKINQNKKHIAPEELTDQSLWSSEISIDEINEN